jgi:hypothetical protein
VIGAARPDAYALKERRDLMRRLVRGDGDPRGRRLFSDAARTDAKFLVRFINQRLRFLDEMRRRDPRVIAPWAQKDVTPRQLAMARASLKRVYQALEDGGSR